MSTSRNAGLRAAPAWQARFLGCGASALAANGILEGALLGLYSAACLLLPRRPLAWLIPWLPVWQRQAAALTVTCGLACAAALTLQALDARLGERLAPALALAAVNPLLWLSLLDGAARPAARTDTRRFLLEAALLLFLAPFCVGCLQALWAGKLPPALALLALAVVAVAWKACRACLQNFPPNRFPGHRCSMPR